MGESHTLRGFCYTPASGVSNGHMSACRVMWSADGVTYHSAGDYTFGNIVNDPSPRYHYLSQSVEARFVTIIATGIAQGEVLNVGEIDIF